tara:strand:- start:567 stop:1163 length:597 start_codon:yes stop_codon:yes gene_type:complete
MSDDSVVEPSVSREELNKAARLAEENKEEEMVRLVNLAMTPCTIFVGHARGHRRVKVEPFGVTPLMPMREAKKYTTPTPNREPGMITFRWVIEPKRHKPGKRESESFVDKNTDITIPTCSWAPPKSQKMFGRPVYHSIRQAQIFMARGLKTVPGVRRYITEFDNRPEVTQYATLVIDYLHGRAQANLGYDVDKTRANV